MNLFRCVLTFDRHCCSHWFEYCCWYILAWYCLGAPPFFCHSISKSLIVISAPWRMTSLVSSRLISHMSRSSSPATNSRAGWPGCNSIWRAIHCPSKCAYLQHMDKNKIITTWLSSREVKPDKFCFGWDFAVWTDRSKEMVIGRVYFVFLEYTSC